MAEGAAAALVPAEADEHRRPADRRLLKLSLAAVLVLSAASLVVGASAVSIGDLIDDEGSARSIVVNSRIPRTMAVVLAGASISVAGLLMQALTQNRFVSPSTAGTMEAAILGVVVASTVAPASSVAAKMVFATGFALAGTMLFVALIQRLRSMDIIIVPLIGIMLGAVLQSVAVFIAYRADLLQSLTTWMVGDFSATIAGRYELLYVVGAAAAAAYLFADRFTLAGVGRDFSVNVGLDYDRTVVIGMTLVSIVSGIVVVVVGAVPFLGLIVPNIITAALGDNQRRVLPLAATAGAGSLLLGDLVSRTIRYPYEIPVGTIVGVVGGGAFLVLLLRSRS